MHYINGKWIEADSKKQIAVFNPATKQLIRKISSAGVKETELAIKAADQAFKKWKNITANDRSKYMHRAVNILKERIEELARIVTTEMGKPLKEAKGEISLAIDYLEWYAEEGKRIYGETIPASHADKRLLVIKQPVGVVAAVTPWNFPVAMVTRKIAPALAAGCTVVLKPASATPLSAIKIFEAFHEAGFPAGVVNLVSGSASEIVGEMTKNPIVKKITFTGSTEVGKMLIKNSADTVKKVSMELGGHAPFIVFKDADLETAVEGAIVSKFRNAGQTCICLNRIYVEKEVAEEFSIMFAERASRLTLGNGLDESVDIGPVIDEKAMDKIKEHVQDAIEHNGRLLCGGKEANIDAEGYFFEPTVISNANEKMKIATEETFGPVAPIFTFQGTDEIISKVNHVHYGLASYLYTNDLSRAFYVMENLEYGMVGINDALPTVAQGPFGGVKESGMGKEGGKHGLEDFLIEKYVSIRLRSL